MTVWDPFRQLSSLREEIGRLFESPLSGFTEATQPFLGGWVPAVDLVQDKDNFSKNAVATQTQEKAPVRNADGAEDQTYLSPAINIFETKDGFVLEAEMPGVNKDGLEVTLEGNALTLVGRRDTGSPGTEVIYWESKPAHFRRVFELDPTIDAAKISARIEQGILTLSLPKTEKVKPRKIAVGE